MRTSAGIIITLFFCMCCCTREDRVPNVRNVRFHPIVLSGDELVPSPSVFDDEYKNNVIQVLRFYKESYSIDKEGNILIPKDKWEDRDLMWNYSNKAKDKTWLESHKP